MSLVLLMMVGVGVLRQYAFAAASSLQARAHAEAVAVLSWKATEAQSAADCSSISTLPDAPIRQLGPDRLTPPEGFRVICQEVDVCWPPPPSTTAPAYDPTLMPCGYLQDPFPSRTITVSWGPVDSERTLKQTVVDP